MKILLALRPCFVAVFAKLRGRTGVALIQLIGRSAEAVLADGTVHVDHANRPFRSYS